MEFLVQTIYLGFGFFGIFQGFRLLLKKGAISTLTIEPVGGCDSSGKVNGTALISLVGL